MEKKKHSSKKRLLAWLLVIAVTLGSIPNTVTYYATEPGSSEGGAKSPSGDNSTGGSQSPSEDNSVNNEAVQIQLLDSYDNLAVTDLSDVTIRYHVVTEDASAEQTDFEVTEDWKTVELEENSTVTNGIVTVLEENTITVSNEEGKVTKVYLQVEKENYVTYKTIVDLEKNSEEEVSPKEISLDKEILKGNLSLTYSEDESGNPTEKILAVLTEKWSTFLEDKDLKYFVKTYDKNATGKDFATSITDADWKENITDFSVSNAGTYEVFVKITEISDTSSEEEQQVVSYTTTNETENKEWVQSVVVEIAKATIEGISITPIADLKYNETDQKLVTVAGLKVGDKVTWTVKANGEEDATTNEVTVTESTEGGTLECGIPTGTLPNDYKVILTVNRGENYEKLTLDVIAKIALGEITLQAASIITVYTGTVYDGNEHNAITDVQNPDRYKFSYYLHICKTDNCEHQETVEEGSWTTNIQSSSLKIKDAGSYWVWIKAEHEYYETKIIAVPITIAKKEISNGSITISKNLDANWIYDENATVWSLVKLDAMIDTFGNLDATNFFNDENSKVTWTVEKSKDDGSWENVGGKVISEKSENDGRTEPPTDNYTPGTYRVTLTIENKNYETYTKTLDTDLVVNKGTFSVSETLTAYSGTYNGNAHPVLTLPQETRSYNFQYHLCNCSNPQHPEENFLTDITYWSTEMPTVKNAGSYEVWVKAVKEHYEDVQVGVYDVEVNKASLKEIIISNPTLVYNITKQNIVTLNRDLVTNATILSDTVNFQEEATWTVKFKSLAKGADWETKLDNYISNDIPKFDIPGTYEVILTVKGVTSEGNNVSYDNYEPFTETVTVTIDQGTINLEGLKVEANSRTYDNTAQPLVNVTTVSGTSYKLEYHVCDDTCTTTHTDMSTISSWTETVIPQRAEAGSYTVWVKATETYYNDEKVEGAPFSVVIEKATQTLGWNENDLPTKDTITCQAVPFAGVTYEFGAKVEGELGNLTGNTIAYKVYQSTANGNVEITNAEINASGTLTVKQPGTYVIEATLDAGNNCEKITPISHTLVVSAEAETEGDFVVFKESASDFSQLVEKVYALNVNSTLVSDTQAFKVNANDNGTITYSIDRTDIGISCDSESGKIIVDNYETLAEKLNNAGGMLTMTVTAEKASGTDDVNNEIFKGDTTSYRLVIKFADKTTEFDLTVSEPAKTGWYNEQNPLTVTVPTGFDYTVAKNITDEFTTSVTFNDQGENKRVVYLKNANGEIAEISLVDEDGKHLKIDTIAPEDTNDNMTITYSEPSWIEKLGQSFGFFDPNVTITFTVKDEIEATESELSYITWFYNKEATATDSILVEKSDTILLTKNGNEYTATLTLTASEAEQYRGNISFTATDEAGNTSNKVTDSEHIIVLDTISPTLKVEYGLETQDGNMENQVNDIYYYSDNVKFTFTMEEANFFESDIFITVLHNGSSISQDITWEHSGDVHIGTFTLSNEGKYEVSMKYLDGESSLDNSNNPMLDAETKENLSVYTSKTIIIDKKDPIIAFAYDKENQTTTFTITEENFSAQGISIDGSVTDVNEIAKTFSAQSLETILRDAEWVEDTDDDGNTIWTYTFNYQNGDTWYDGFYDLTIGYTDNLGRVAVPVSTGEFIIDHTAPEMKVGYSEPTKKVGDVSYYNGVNQELNVNNPVDVTLTITEPNFDVNNVNISVIRDKDEANPIPVDVTWSTDENNKEEHIGTFTISEDGHYDITITYTDNFKNEMQKYEHIGKIVVDSEIPTIEVVYTQKDDANEDVVNILESATSNDKNYFSKVQTATITVTERNFDLSNVKVDIIETAHDGSSLGTDKSFYTISDWSDGTESNTHVLTITYLGDANYSFDIYATDIVGNEAVDYETQYFTVDTSAPDASTSNLVVTYSDAISFVEKIVNTVKQWFGFYNNTVTVTFTAEDDISGIQSFKWKTANETEWKTEPATVVSGKYTAEIKLSDEMRDLLEVMAVNKAGCESDVQEGDRVIVVDKVSPELKVEHTLSDTTDDDGKETVSSTVVENGQNVHYYSDDVEFTFTVIEENFFAEDIFISVSKDGADAQLLESEKITWTTKEDGKTHEGTFVLTEEGDYIVSMKYLNGEESQDNSNNPMVDAEAKQNLKEYKSELITIDKKDPEIQFSYNKTAQTTTFTVTEHNFRKEHISLDAQNSSIKDVNGKDTGFTVENLQSVLQNAEWTQDGDVYKYTFDYKKDGVSLDGIYDLAIVYEDFVSRTAINEPENFIIDRTKPLIDVKYNDSAREFNGVSYYSGGTKNPLEVTIAIDEQNFVEGSVIVTVTRDEAEVSNPTVTWSTPSDTAKNIHEGTFSLTKDGHYDIQVTYTDSFGNVMEVYELVDGLVIDSTPSVIDVTYTTGNVEDNQSSNVINTLEDSKANNRKYFGEKHNVVITVTERNFNKDEVVITLTPTAHDLNETLLENVIVSENTTNEFYKTSKWVAGTEENTHVLTIECMGDANYDLDILYADLATNETSKQDYFTVDTTKPSVENLEIIYPETNFVDKFINGLEEQFGFHGSDNTTVTVTFTADDATAGIKSFKWKTNMDSVEEWQVVEAVVDSENPNKYTAEITLPNTMNEVEQLRAYVQVVAIDKSGNESDIKDESGKNIIVDTISPMLQVNHMLVDETGVYQLVDGVHYYSGDVMFTFIIEEANFFPNDVQIFVSKDEGTPELLASEDISWLSSISDENIHYGTILLSGDGDYVVSMNYQDNSGNVTTGDVTEGIEATYQSDVITIDTIDPEVDFSYDRETQSTTVTVTEHNFRPEDIRIDEVSTITDINGNATDFAVTELEAVLQSAEWTQEGDVYKYTFDYKEDEVSLDGIYDLKLDYTDLTKKDATSCEPETFIIDRTPATDVEITYEKPFFEKALETITFGFYQAKMEVTFTAYDNYSGVDTFSWNYIQTEGTSGVNRPTDETETVADAVQDASDKSKYTATIALSDKQTEAVEQMHGHLSVFTTDNYQNKSNKITDDGRVFILDTISPTMRVEYSLEDNSIGEGKFRNSYYQGDAIVTFYVNEANFYAEDVEVFVSKDGQGQEKVIPTWTDVNVDEHIGTYTLSGDGDYVVYVMYDDYSGNTMTDAENGNTVMIYQSHVITIDTINPEVDFSYDRATQSTIVTVTEHNFRPEDIRIDATKDGETPKSSITDINGKATDFTVEELEAVLQKATWTQDKINADVYTYTFDYKENNVSLDGIYDLKLDYTDLSKRTATSCEPENFIIDRTPATDVEITYQTPLFEKVLETITFGFYNPTVEVTFTAYDDYSGVDTFSWNYIQTEGTSSVNRPTDETETVADAVQDVTDKSKYTATIILSDKQAEEIEQMHGHLSVFATDNYQNKGDKVTDSGNVLIVDTISPTMRVEYSLANNSIETSKGENSYYQSDAIVTFYVNEANFYGEDVEVLVSKDGQEAQRVTPTWTDIDADEHIGTYTLSGDGDYVVYVTYDDYSENIMTDEETGTMIKQYQSHMITIDTINPEVELSYDKATQSTTVTVTEHNFRPEDIRIDATKDGETPKSSITDINGKATDFTVEELEAILQKATWTQDKTNADVYTYTFDYKENNVSLDGIYDLKLDYTDLSKRTATSCEPENFIIDRTSATNVSIAYETPLFEKILEIITLGFYNPTVEVTFTAYDNYSGVDTFSWNYIQREGTSSVNRPTDEKETVVKAVQDTTDKSKYTASIVLSDKEANELKQLEQMHGYLSVFTTDKYQNQSAKISDDGRVFVVDTISPTMSVEYSLENNSIETSVGKNSYYQGNATVTFYVNEANFYAEDVEVFVSKDGQKAQRVTPIWTDTDVDNHVGTYTLSGDGDYIVSVKYDDYSGNVMAEYQSHIITIDTINPEVAFSYDKATQSTTVTVTEHNFRPEDIRIDGEISTITDVNGNRTEYTVAELEAVLQKATWTQSKDNKDVYMYTFDYKEESVSLDGIYDLKLDYTDLSKRTATSCEPENFIIDRTSATNVSIAYETPLFEKILETITLGFYNPTVEVTFTAYDIYSGVESFSWNYIQREGTSTVNRPTDSKETVAKAVQDKTDKSKYTASIVLSDKEADELKQLEQMHGYLSVFTTDNYQNKSAKISDDGRVFVVDTISPTMKVEYSLENNSVETNAGKNSYYQGDATVTFYVNEANFYGEDVEVLVSKDGQKAQRVTPTWKDTDVDNHVGTYILSGDGDYVVTVKYDDYSGNEMKEYQSHVITIDTINPEVAFSYDRETQSTTFTVMEHNFRPEDIRIDATKDGETSKSSITDVNGNATEYTVTDLEAVLQNATWTQSAENTDVWTYTFDYKENEVSLDGIYALKLDYTDLAKRDAISCEPDNFIIDRTPANNVSIAYETSLFEMILEKITLGFYNPTVTVTFTAYDSYSGVESFSWNYIQSEGTSTVNRPTDTTETVVKVVQDKTDKSKYMASIVLSDKEVDELRQLEQMHGYLSVFTTDKYQNQSAKITDDGRVFVVDTISPTMKVEYSSQDTQSDDKTISYYQGDVGVTFYVNEANFYEENVKVTLSKDGKKAEPITVEWADVNVDEHIGKYTISGDGDYILYVTYSDYSQNVMVDEVTKEELTTYQSHIITIDTINPIIDFTFNEAEQTTTFSITEHNFHSEGIVVNGTRKDLNDNDLHFEEVGLTELLQNAKWEQNGDVYTYTFDYKKENASLDGIYNLTLDYTDLSDRVAETHQPKAFTIDRTASSNVTFSYSKSIVDTILETVTLGFYNPKVIVTLTSYDDYIGVDYFEWHYTRQADVSETNRATDARVTQIKAVQDNQDKSKFTATFELPNTDAKQLRGYLAATVTDKYKNTSQNVNDAGRVVVVDTISPTITAEYSDADRIVGTNAYYNNDVVVTFIVNEANFFANDVKVSVSKDGGNPYTLKTNWTDLTTDVHVGTCTLSGDGDYVITVNYTDRSLNKMRTYTSHVLTIDTILPAIDVAYRNVNVINTLADSEEQERQYFSDTQTAVVTITEHNFNAEEVEFSIVAKDVTGAELDADRLHTKAEWVDDGDTHVAVITYPGDANYTFDVAYTDLATNVAEDYEPDYFTVDNTAPINLKTEYSTSLLDTILETITFGFYNAKVTVTLTAEDETSGVHEFKYSYMNAIGVSGVNAQLIDQAISASEIVYSNSGKTATVEFSIPKDVLTDVTQFNGTVSFEAIDRAGLKNNLEDNRRIVVDNIAPTAQVTYNEPVNMEGTISYYDSDVQATVVINEANFYPEDVVVTVSKDGGASYAVTPSWTNNSADVHTGTFTLSEDGDYFITITYRDKSSNEMTVYTSEQLTIDTDIEAPIILFNGNNENGQAYKGEIVPTISFTDVNYDSFEVHLYRTYKGARDIEITEEKDLNGLFTISEQSGDATLNIFAIGDDGRYNPNDDGIYHLVIKMNDKSGHTVDSEAYFTVNRYGSVYEYSEYLSSLIADGGAYVMKVTEDLVITEYNADRLVNESLDIEITRDGKPLDTVEYSVSPAINEHVAVGESGWFQYEYTISKDNFAEDGIYKISVSSKDATGNAPENSNFEDKNIRFYVDSTVPEITSIVGLEDSVVNSTQLNIRYMVFDVVGLKSVKVYVDGEVMEEITDFGEEFNHYEGDFTLEESENRRTVRLVVEDLAGNITDTDSNEFTSAFAFNREVMVTTNSVVRFLANEELVNTVIAGSVAVATATGGAIFFKRRRRMGVAGKRDGE